MQGGQTEEPIEPIKPRHDTSMMLTSPGRTAGERSDESDAGDALGDFAADLGAFLGTVQSRASSWMDQRKAIAEQLTQIRDTANQYLEQLAGTAQSAVAAVARRRSGRAGAEAQGAQRAAGARKGLRRRLSEEARQRIAEAQRKRWARHRKEQAK
jgi:hypothetical protein